MAGVWWNITAKAAPTMIRDREALTMEIRLATPSDAEGVAEIYGPVVRDTGVSFEEHPPGPAEIAERIRSTVPDFPWLVFDDGKVLGYAYAGGYRTRGAYRWSVETTVYVHPECHRRGVGRGLYTSLLGILELQGFMTALAGITQPNEPSVALHESVGFELVGIYLKVGYKLGRWRDVGWWQRQVGDTARPHHMPRPLAEVEGSEGWDAALAAGLALIRP